MRSPSRFADSSARPALAAAAAVEAVLRFLPPEWITTVTKLVDMSWFSPLVPKLVPQVVPLIPVDERQMSRSLGWQLMPFALRLVEFTKCGVVELPAQSVMRLATAKRMRFPQIS